MNLLKVYYDYSCEILKEHLPCIPEMRYSTAKKYYGKISRRNNNKYIIYLSKFNHLYKNDWLFDKEEQEEIINTVCHELAHLIFWEHGKNHTKVTKLFSKIVNGNLRLMYLNSKEETN
ncbi:MAG: SprT-like domain-containing protein [Syntrophothermus sp.]